MTSDSVNNCGTTKKSQKFKQFSLSRSAHPALIVNFGLLPVLPVVAVPFGRARAPFIALGALGLSGWLCVFAYPLFRKNARLI